METGRPTRRRSPSWVRQWTSPALHAVAGKMNRMRTSADLTAAQEWLYDAIVNELEYRRRRQPFLEKCSCWLCCPPFDDVGQPEEPF